MHNPHIKRISLENMKGILFSSWKISGYYIPLTFLSFAADHALFGLNAKAFYRTNMILHTLNVLLVFWFFYLLSQNVPIAFWGAAFFSIHPLHVEAISWVTERKGLLASFFLLGAMVSYLRHLERPSKIFYGGSILFFFLSLLSKPSGLMLPFLLLLLDHFKGRPLNQQAFYGKIPFFVGSLLFGIFSFWGQESRGVMGSNPIIAVENLLVACYGVFFYLGKFFYPVDLSAYYPYPANFSMIWLALASGLILEMILLRKFREIFFSQMFFLVAILPAIKLVRFGNFVAADRLTYFPSLGLFFLFGWVLYNLWGKAFAIGRFKKGIVLLTAVIFLGILSGMSRDRLQVWQDSEKLWKSVIEPYPRVALAHTNLGHHYAQQGRIEESISEYQKALILDPEDALTLNNLGTVYRRKGMFDEAIAAYKRVLEMKPNYALAYTNLGVAYEQKGMLDEALSAHLKALAIEPQNALAHTNLGVVYMRKGMLEKAIEEHRQAIALDPNQALAHANLGAAYGQQGMLDEAIAEFKKALSLDPSYAKVHHNLGVAYQIKSEMNLAEYHFERAFNLGYKPSAQVLELLKRKR